MSCVPTYTGNGVYYGAIGTGRAVARGDNLNGYCMEPVPAGYMSEYDDIMLITTRIPVRFKYLWVGLCPNFVSRLSILNVIVWVPLIPVQPFVLPHAALAVMRMSSSMSTAMSTMLCASGRTPWRALSTRFGVLERVGLRVRVVIAGVDLGVGLSVRVLIGIVVLFVTW